MRRMSVRLRIVVRRQTDLRSVLAVVVLCAGLAQARQAAKPAAAAAGDAARGKYLVENVAMCVQCHTPRNGDGTLDRTRLLQGAPVIWAPANGDPNWPLVAPRIGGSMPASDADMIKLLTTGVWTTGQPLRLPMMPFRMNEADARAVIAYLKSVTSAQ
jgi:mono/diheme cytochrome c family protein